MLDDLGPGELDWWLAFYQLEPFGDEWLRTSLTCATVANYNAWGLKRPLKADHFMPVRRAAPQFDPETIYRQFMAAVGVLGLRVIDTRPCRKASDTSCAAPTK